MLFTSSLEHADILCVLCIKPPSNPLLLTQTAVREGAWIKLCRVCTFKSQFCILQNSQRLLTRTQQMQNVGRWQRQVCPKK